MIRMRKKGTRTLLWYYANDQKTKVVNEIKCCDCFFDIMLVFKERFLNLIDENVVDNEILEKTFIDFCLEVDTKDQDVFMIFADECIVICEKTIYNYHSGFGFENVDFLDEKLSYECLADSFECNCMYFLEKNLTHFPSLCFACRCNFLRMVSVRLIKIKLKKN